MRIETDRLILRPWRDGDRDAFAALMAEPAVAGGEGMDRSDSLDLLDSYRAHWDADGLGAVECRASGRLLGTAGLAWCRFDAPRCPSVEIGWGIAADCWGRGLAAEAARAWLAAAFGPLGFRDVLAFTLSDNPRSLALLARLGFRGDGSELPPPHLCSAAAPDRRRLSLSLSRDDWQAAAGSGHVE